MLAQIAGQNFEPAPHRFAAWRLQQRPGALAQGARQLVGCARAGIMPERFLKVAARLLSLAKAAVQRAGVGLAWC
ncbi:hypothetical protein SE17_17730, partial [Kouleothrix aurantiaca]